MTRTIVALLLALASSGCALRPAPAASSAHENPPGDARVAVVLDTAERNFVLAEMRQFVEAMRGIVQGIADNDMKRVAAAARTAGIEAHRAEFSDPGSLASRVGKKAPPEFRKLGFATHRAFDEMALHADQFGDREHLLRSLADTMGNCVACHAAYRFPER